MLVVMKILLNTEEPWQILWEISTFLSVVLGKM